MAVVIETTLGCLTVDLFVVERPITCANFLKLCKMKYYNFCLFHSVQTNFIAQTGDPTGTGNGGKSVFSMVHGEKANYYEAEALPEIKHSRAGLVSMVNCGSNMLGSQFFFTLANELNSLDSEHCVFGEVTEGLDILIRLNKVMCDEAHHPFRDVRILHTVILEDPFDDPANITFPADSPKLTNELLMNGRIAPDEEVDSSKGKTPEDVEEMVHKEESQACATILEIVGDIPYAGVAPPENILFVCRLDPLTTEEDLEIIFGRFGAVKSCKVIRDKITGNSLLYAFIEFENKKSCENAYFKMNNVIINDRRIHVDFGQSVAKMIWKNKAKVFDCLYDKNFEEQQRRNYKYQRNFSKDRRTDRSRSSSQELQNGRGNEERNLTETEKRLYKTKTKGWKDVGIRHGRNCGSRNNKNWNSHEICYTGQNKYLASHVVRHNEHSKEDERWKCKYRGDRSCNQEAYDSLVKDTILKRRLESPESDKRNHGQIRAKACALVDRKCSAKERFSANCKNFEYKEKRYRRHNNFDFYERRYGYRKGEK